MGKNEKFALDDRVISNSYLGFVTLGIQDHGRWRENNASTGLTSRPPSQSSCNFHKHRQILTKRVVINNRRHVSLSVRTSPDRSADLSQVLGVNADFRWKVWHGTRKCTAQTF